MKLDQKALQEVFAEVDMLAQGDVSSAEEGKAIATGLIELYIKKLGARDIQIATINLTNARAGMLAIMDSCKKAEQELKLLETPLTKGLCDAFVRYLRIIAVQADAHYADNLN